MKTKIKMEVERLEQNMSKFIIDVKIELKTKTQYRVGLENIILMMAFAKITCKYNY